MLSLQESLKNGEIDILTSLHQPSSPVNKEVAFYDAEYGCESIEDILPLYYTKLVKTGLITMGDLVKLTVKNPANSIKQESGTIKVGDKVNAMLFNPESVSKISNKQSLYNNEELIGKVTTTFQGENVTKF